MDGLLHLDVDGTGGIVEHHHRWVDQQGPGDGDPLALATREGVAPLADHGVVAVGEVADELVSPSRGGRRFDLLVGGRWSAVSDVVADRHREQERLVEDDTDVGPQAGLGELADIVSVEFDRAVAHVVEPGEQSGHGRLTRSGPTHDGHRLPWLNVEVEVGQYQLFGVLAVGEVDVPEPDIAGAVREVDRIGAVGHGGLLVEDLVDPPSRGGGPLAHHDQHAEHHERRLHHQQIGVEGQDGPDPECAVDDHVAAEDEYQGQSDLGQVLDQRGEAGPQVGIFDVAPLHPLGRPRQGP